MLKTLTDRVSALEIENKALHEKILKHEIESSQEVTYLANTIRQTLENLGYVIDRQTEHFKNILTLYSDLEFFGTVTKKLTDEYATICKNQTQLDQIIKIVYNTFTVTPSSKKH